MITAIVLVCTIETRSDCYTTTYGYMFNDILQCEKHITTSIKQGVFKTTVDNQLYDLYDYRCINWNYGMV